MRRRAMHVRDRLEVRGGPATTTIYPWHEHDEPNHFFLKQIHNLIEASKSPHIPLEPSLSTCTFPVQVIIYKTLPIFMQERRPEESSAVHRRRKAGNHRHR